MKRKPHFNREMPKARSRQAKRVTAITTRKDEEIVKEERPHIFVQNNYNALNLPPCAECKLPVFVPIYYRPECFHVIHYDTCRTLKCRICHPPPSWLKKYVLYYVMCAGFIFNSQAYAVHQYDEFFMGITAPGFFALYNFINGVLKRIHLDVPLFVVYTFALQSAYWHFVDSGVSYHMKPISIWALYICGEYYVQLPDAVTEKLPRVLIPVVDAVVSMTAMQVGIDVLHHFQLIASMCMGMMIFYMIGKMPTRYDFHCGNCFMFLWLIFYILASVFIYLNFIKLYELFWLVYVWFYSRILFPRRVFPYIDEDVVMCLVVCLALIFIIYKH